MAGSGRRIALRGSAAQLTALSAAVVLADIREACAVERRADTAALAPPSLGSLFHPRPLLTAGDFAKLVPDWYPRRLRQMGLDTKKPRFCGAFPIAGAGIRTRDLRVMGSSQEPR